MKAGLFGQLTRRTPETADATGTSRWHRLMPVRWRTKPMRVALITVSIIVLMIGTAINVRLHMNRVSLEQKVKDQEQALSGLPALLRQLETERHTRVNLTAERELLYAGVPDLSSIPLVTEQLEQLASFTGGRVLRVNYTPAAWSDNRSEVLMSVRFQGSFLSVLMYLHGIKDSFPTANIRQVALESDRAAEGGRLTVEALVGLAVLETRLAQYAPWDEQRMTVRPVPPVASPFDAPLRAWDTGRQLGLDLPHWSLRGIIDNNGSRTALLNVNGRPHVVRVGEWVDDVQVAAIQARHIELRMDGREAVLRLEGH